MAAKLKQSAKARKTKSSTSDRQKPMTKSSGGLTIVKKMLEKTDDALTKEIANRAAKFYKQEAKPRQIETIMNLSRGRNTFLMAGTGFGKSRIPEIYHLLLPKTAKPVVVVLNPLDALGENQVLEKKGKFLAINLTKLTFNKKEAAKIKNGDYNFVYLSPEIFMNSQLWDSVYFSAEFQQRLALVVVDEAHMIYLWGLVESNGRRVNCSFVRIEDAGVFRPCYGKLALHLQCRNNAPLLLLSATCRPVAVDSILKNLKLTNDLIDIIRDELTRCEIRIVRINMSHSLASNLDLLDVFPTRDTTPDEDLVPTLIYSGTRTRTLTVLQVLDMARGTPGSCYNPRNSFARRFHSCTGEKDKVSCVEDYANGRFPMISATMALGLGQNWKRVRSVIHMGRGDPANIAQMIGRCGRDGKPGLAILFVEPTRKGGKNSVADFVDQQKQSDDDRMDALAITPICLRVAFAIDNMHGYIPVSKEDPNYLAEISREKSLSFPPCRCSNCAIDSCKTLVQNLKNVTINNFDEVMNDSFSFSISTNKHVKQTARRPKPKSGAMDTEGVLKDFGLHLIRCFREYYNARTGDSARFAAEDLFDKAEADAIVSNFDEIHDSVCLGRLMGGEVIEGQLDYLMTLISQFKVGGTYQEHLKIQQQRHEEKEEERKRKRREYQARYRAKKRLQLLSLTNQQNTSNVAQHSMPGLAGVEKQENITKLN
ncbi:ATP-dependent DNA helicase sgs1 [Puccinia graminis f. sp. tritici]|uniref:DNA 3'-5' helicase n=1 Tax=Puccinia graminis f. sp. tritici TaxID=56615 RepID=A0A5B0PH04_PUCGR|nr:ATP-dependent DNA helicase sgs1 [Puccinia graminis f. sp. tritici]KAA1123509.1 ATP-dependent DNA helicase sgs1 [Puccinia graminis f. sp. tritici]